MSVPVHGDPKIDERVEDFIRRIKHDLDDTTLRNLKYDTLRELDIEIKKVSIEIERWKEIMLLKKLGGLKSSISVNNSRQITMSL